uniref:Uncharacterized protein n=1 Tax=Arundo donax TaxID=35708 RepID=A0A0A9BCT7_ARUDO
MNRFRKFKLYLYCTACGLILL